MRGVVAGVLALVVIGVLATSWAWLADEDVAECSVYAQGRGAAATFTGPGAGRVCDDAQRRWSDGLTFWTQRGEVLDRRTVCELARDRFTVRVSDTGGAAIGAALCSGFVREGWTED